MGKATQNSELTLLEPVLGWAGSECSNPSAQVGAEGAPAQGGVVRLRLMLPTTISTGRFVRSLGGETCPLAAGLCLQRRLLFWGPDPAQCERDKAAGALPAAATFLVSVGRRYSRRLLKAVWDQLQCFAKLRRCQARLSGVSLGHRSVDGRAVSRGAGASCMLSRGRARNMAGPGTARFRGTLEGEAAAQEGMVGGRGPKTHSLLLGENTAVLSRLPFPFPKFH